MVAAAEVHAVDPTGAQRREAMWAAVLERDDLAAEPSEDVGPAEQPDLPRLVAELARHRDGMPGAGERRSEVVDDHGAPPQEGAAAEF